MKFLSSFTLLAATLASVSAHTSLKFPLPRASPLNPNAAVKDFNCLTAPYNGGAGCPKKPFPCGGYPQDTKITQVLTAGQVISASFWNPNFPDGPKPGDEGRDQARHNGGICDFALSYDGGNTYTKIATYHGSCPDIFFDWKVKIPINAPSCDNPGKCIFSWSWINAVGNREFYQNCADVKIVGTATKPLPIIDITRANLPGTFDNILTPPGDNPNNGNTKGSGPSQADTSANLALTIGGGDGGGSGGNNGNNGNNDPTTTKPASTKTTSPTPTKGSVVTSSPIATPTPVSTGKENGASCSDEGKDSCVDPGSSPSFATCDHGQVIIRSCVGGTVCQPAGDSIQCGRSSR